MRSIVSSTAAALFLCLLNPLTLGAPTLAAAFVPGTEGGGRGEGGKCRALALLTKLSVGCTYLDSLSGSSSGNESGEKKSGRAPSRYVEALLGSAPYSLFVDELSALEVDPAPPAALGAPSLYISLASEVNAATASLAALGAATQPDTPAVAALPPSLEASWVPATEAGATIVDDDAALVTPPSR